jgi:hypothetical protein
VLGTVIEFWERDGIEGSKSVKGGLRGRVEIFVKTVLRGKRAYFNRVLDYSLGYPQYGLTVVNAPN